MKRGGKVAPRLNSQRNQMAIKKWQSNQMAIKNCNQIAIDPQIGFIFTATTMKIITMTNECLCTCGSGVNVQKHTILETTELLHGQGHEIAFCVHI